MLFFVPQSLPDAVKYVYVFIMYNLVNAVFYTAMLVPYYSMISLVTTNANERGMLGNIQQIFQTLANVVINSVFIVMLTAFTDSTETIYTQRAFTITMIIISAAMVLLSFICVFCTKERVTDNASDGSQEKGKKDAAANPVQSFKALITNRYWVMMFFAMFVIFFVIIMYSVGNVYYCQYIYKDMSRYPWMSNAISVAQFAIMFATPFFMSRFGKRNIYVAGLGILTVGFLGFGLFADSLPTIIFFNALKGLGLGMSGGMAMGMVADTITYSRLKSGIDPVGMGNAAISAAQKLGLGLGTAVLGWVMSGAGFDAALDLAGESQPDTVITAILFLYNYVFVWIFDWGMAGAALATVIGQAVTMLAAVIFFFVKKAGFHLPAVSDMPALFGGLCKVAVAPFGLTISPTITIILMNRFLLLYGNEQAVAVYSCISYVVCIAYLLLQGVGDGSQPLISRCYGENDITGMVRIRGLAYKTAYGITVACMAGLFLGRDLVGVLFGASADACREVAFYLPFFLATLLFVSFVRVTTSYFYATEKTGLSYALVFAEPLFQLVLLLLLPLFLGLLGVWLAVPLAQVLAWIVSVCAKRRVDHKIQMAGKE